VATDENLRLIPDTVLCYIIYPTEIISVQYSGRLRIYPQFSSDSDDDDDDNRCFINDPPTDIAVVESIISPVNSIDVIKVKSIGN
jgi:hypothetical protein